MVISIGGESWERKVVGSRIDEKCNLLCYGVEWSGVIGRGNYDVTRGTLVEE